MRTVFRGAIHPIETQSLYHAAALAVSKRIIPNTLYICWPSKPLVSIGFHQELAIEVDVEFCKKKNIEIIRRRVGGGAVFLDSNQVFYQIVLHKETTGIPKKIGTFYQTMLQAPINTYRKFGIEARFSPVNDIINSEGKKISGNGAGRIEDAIILVGNIIVDFDFDLMVSVLKVPSEKFRDKMAKSLRDRLGTLKMAIDTVPSHQDISKELIAQFSKIFPVDSKTETELSHSEKNFVNELNKLYRTNEWLFSTSQRHEDLVQKRSVIISGNYHIFEGALKAPGGLIRVTTVTEENKIVDTLITGDFSIEPSNAISKIESAITGLPVDLLLLENKINDLYHELTIDSPGITPVILAKTIFETISGKEQ